MVEDGVMWIPPPCEFNPMEYLITQLRQQPTVAEPDAIEVGEESLTNEDHDQLQSLLLALDQKKKRTVARISIFVIQRAHKYSKELLKQIELHYYSTSEVSNKLSLMMLINDLAFNAVRCSEWPLQKSLSEMMPSLFLNLAKQLEKVESIKQK